MCVKMVLETSAWKPAKTHIGSSIWLSGEEQTHHSSLIQQVDDVIKGLEPFLLPSLMSAKWVKVAQSCLTLCSPVDYTIHGIL